MAEIVRRYPVLYDQAHKGYERDAVKNDWKEVSAQLDFIEGEDGEKATQYFNNFKKRYLRRRNEVIKCNKSGTTAASIAKAKRELE